MLNGKLVSLRALEPSDIELLYQWENDSSVWLVSGTKAPFSKFVLEEFINSSKQDIYTTKQLRLVISLNESNKTIGFIDLFDFDPLHLRAGLGILIGKEEWRGKGYGKEALQLFIQYVTKHLKLHQLFCHVQKSNTKSISLFENTGFTISGELNDWILNEKEWENVYILQRISIE